MTIDDKFRATAGSGQPRLASGLFSVSTFWPKGRFGETAYVAHTGLLRCLTIASDTA